MKMIIAIVQDDDAARLISQLMKNGFGATKLATTGGFLRAGNTTLLIGVEDEKLSKAMGIIEEVCKRRKQAASAPTSMGSSGSLYTASSFPVEVTVGGATVFVLPVEQFVKM